VKHPLVRIAVAAGVLGTVGFLCGFIGPLKLNPSANQGPLTGIFFTGPGGFLLGILLAILPPFRGWRPPAFAGLITVVALLVGASTLYGSLPEDRYQGSLVDATVEGCMPPTALVDVAERTWTRYNLQDQAWRTPWPNWQSTLSQAAASPDGVVLRLHIHRTRKIYELRKPWNYGRLSATRWKSVERSENHYSRQNGASCTQYTLGERRIYAPAWEPSDVSPPDILPTYLGLYVLQAAPPRFLPFTGGDRASNPSLQRTPPG
jgi:hypothetical protein